MGSPPKDTIWESLHQVSFFSVTLWARCFKCREGGGGNDRHLYRYYSIVADDAVNLTSELHDPNAQVNHLHKRRKKKT